MRLSPCDAVFARLGGAGDRLDAGESTFLVECAEAASVLRGATRDSLVVLDELGRGTSTFDGYAVAYASFASLAHRVGCRLMFATHYHALSREFRRSPAARLGHMAAEVTESEEDAGGAGEAVGPDRLDRAARKRSIVFLYELRAGSCPKSHGTNVAGLAGIPEKILVRAENVAAAMEKKLSGVFGNAERRGAGAGALTAGEVEALRRTVFRAGAAHLDFTGLEKLWSRLRETRDSVW
jgi:DNA mismatch repair protein MSH6